MYDEVNLPDDVVNEDAIEYVLTKSVYVHGNVLNTYSCIENNNSKKTFFESDIKNIYSVQHRRKLGIIALVTFICLIVCIYFLWTHFDSELWRVLATLLLLTLAIPSYEKIIKDYIILETGNGERIIKIDDEEKQGDIAAFCRTLRSHIEYLSEHKSDQ